MSVLRARYLLLILVFCLKNSSLFSQDILNQYWSPSSSSQNIETLIGALEQDFQLIFSYSSDLFDDYKLPNNLQASSVRKILDLLFSEKGIDYEFVSDDKILLFAKKQKVIKISGLIRDNITKESIPGSFIELVNLNSTIQTNFDGFFYCKVIGEDSLRIRVRALSHASQDFTFHTSQEDIALELEFTNEIPIITIRPGEQEQGVPTIDPPTEYSISELNSNFSILGGHEILDEIKSTYLVDVGSEMQNGFIVKGGNPYQNLIIVDGMSLFEISHIGGISSYFFSPALQQASLHTTGFSAEYGGRLSSVLDIKVKEGSTIETTTELGLGLEGLSLHHQMPLIKNKTSLSFSGRWNQMDLLVRPILNRVLAYEDVSLYFGDVYAKLHHQFSPFNRLSFTYYQGMDRIGFNTLGEFQTSTGSIMNDDTNDLRWGNQILSLQWASAISNNLFFHFNVGKSKYDYNEEGRYIQLNNSNNQEEERSVYTDTESEIEEVRANANFDLYLSSSSKIKFGVGYIYQEFNPFLKEEFFENDELVQFNEGFVREYFTNQYYFFLEDRVQINRFFSFQAGVHWNKYFEGAQSYVNVEPRLRFEFKSKYNSLVLGASRMHQHNHVLSNPGPGLPSNLWVTTADNLLPAESDELSFEFSSNRVRNLQIHAHVYYKQFRNIKDFQATSDIYFALLNNEKISPTAELSSEWAERIIEGDGYSSGFGLNVQYNSHIFNANIAYLYSQTRHRFDQIDAGESFNAPFDRPHNLTIELHHPVSKNWNIFAKWVFGSGYPFTLPVADPNFEEQTIELVTPFRNNARLDDFHHLDLSASYNTSFAKGTLEFTFGAYNIYNRRNPFYAYVTQGESQLFNLSKVSVFPIIPHISFHYKR